MRSEENGVVEQSEALEVFVGLLAETEADGPKEAFYGRLCEAVCRLTRMERAILFVYDDARHEVRAVGGHGIDPAAFAETQVTIDVAPSPSARSSRTASSRSPPSTSRRPSRPASPSCSG